MCSDRHGWWPGAAFLAGLFLAGLVAGCSGGSSDGPKARPVGIGSGSVGGAVQPLSPVRLIEQHNRRGAELPLVWANRVRLAAQLSDRSGLISQRFDLDGRLLYEPASGRLWLRATLAEEEVFAVGQDALVAWVLVRGDVNRLWYGLRGESRGGRGPGAPIHPDDLVEALGLGRLPYAAVSGYVLLGDGAMIELRQREDRRVVGTDRTGLRVRYGQPSRVVRRYLFESGTGRLLQIERPGGGGGEGGGRAVRVELSYPAQVAGAARADVGSDPELDELLGEFGGLMGQAAGPGDAAQRAGLAELPGRVRLVVEAAEVEALGLVLEIDLGPLRSSHTFDRRIFSPPMVPRGVQVVPMGG